MIEMRWLVRYSVLDISIGFTSVADDPVLQYRQKVSSFDSAGFEVVAEWMDVPMVFEEKSE
jgi:hypothetical protein